MSNPSVRMLLGDDSAPSMLITSDDVRLLAAIGFLSAKSGCVAPAIRIFESLIKLRPGAVFPFIGLSIAYMAVGMSPESLYVLTERATTTRTEDDTLYLWRSLAFHQSGNRTQASTALQKYLSGPLVDDHHALVEKLTKELGLRPVVPDWPLPAVVSDQETAF
jgi:predicted Zn-dependent protease